MRVIFSRKGFDAGCGGCPSPIFSDGQMTSLPIPGGAADGYASIASPVGPLDALVRALTRGKLTGQEVAHLDPDLNPESRPRLPGWIPSLGQTGVAQSHLVGQGVGPGDLFVFFGCFRPVEPTDNGWQFVRGSKEEHVILGYLQIGEVVPLGATPDVVAELARRPWLAGHPHLHGSRDANNTLYLASPELVLPDGPTGLPGGAHFPRYAPERVLTAPEASKSLWAIPAWLQPQEGLSTLSYHGSADRWQDGPDGSPRLQTVAKGQEFVIDTAPSPEAWPWLRATLGASPALVARPSRRALKG